MSRRQRFDNRVNDAVVLKVVAGLREHNWASTVVFMSPNKKKTCCTGQMSFCNSTSAWKRSLHYLVLKPQLYWLKSSVRLTLCFQFYVLLDTAYSVHTEWKLSSRATPARESKNSPCHDANIFSWNGIQQRTDTHKYRHSNATE